MGRYDTVETATFSIVSDDGSRRLVRYQRRRFPPAAPTGRDVPRHLVRPGDRLDLLSYRYTGDPLGFWRICDVNAVLDPDDLVNAEAVGTEIALPPPGMATP